MKSNFVTLMILALPAFLCTKAYSQCSLTIPAQGSCTGCTANPSGSITLSTNNSTACYSGTGTISTLTINGSNITVYICGTITITTIAGSGTGATVVVNAGKSLTLTNQPGNFYVAPTYVNYGTFKISSSWSNFYSGKLITSGASAVTSITGDLTYNGSTVYMDGGIMNISGTSTFNAGSYLCLNNNAIYNSANLTNNANSVVSVGAGSSACVSFTGNANINTNYFSSSILNVSRGTSATGTSPTSTAWGSHVTVITSSDPYSCAITLPMVMGDFSLNNSGTKVIANWSTFSEQNSNHFEIQRSSDAVAFTTIGTIAASGNSASTKQYSFTDYYPLIGNNYYRIKLVSDDGNPSYSAVKEIEITAPSEMKVIVNSSQNNLKIMMPENSAQSTLRLLDMQGRLLKTVTTGSQQATVVIETTSISSGIYIVELLSGKTHQAKQVFVPVNN